MWLCRNEATYKRLESLIKTLNSWGIPLILLINYELIRTWRNETNFLAYLCSSEEGRALLHSQYLTEGRPIIDGLLSFALEPIGTFPTFAIATNYLKKETTLDCLFRWSFVPVKMHYGFFFAQSYDPQETEK